MRNLVAVVVRLIGSCAALIRADGWLLVNAILTWVVFGMSAVIRFRADEWQVMADVHWAEVRYLDRVIEEEINEAYARGWVPRARG